MTAFVICVGSSLLSKTVDVTYVYTVGVPTATTNYTSTVRTFYGH